MFLVYSTFGSRSKLTRGGELEKNLVAEIFLAFRPETLPKGKGLGVDKSSYSLAVSSDSDLKLAKFFSFVAC